MIQKQFYISEKQIVLPPHNIVQHFENQINENYCRQIQNSKEPCYFKSSLTNKRTSFPN